jgi:hypothetical protein
MTGRSNFARSVLLSVVVAALLFVALVAYAPDATAFSPNNYGWNGLQTVASKYDLHFTASLAGLGAGQRTVLIVMQPVSPFTSADAQDVGSFLRQGGTVVVADNNGMSNSLLQGLGLGIAVQGQYAVLDSTYNWKENTLPTILVYPFAQKQFPFLSGVQGVAMNEPSPLFIRPDSGAEAIATSSPLSVETYRSSLSASALLLGSPKAVAQGSIVVAAIQHVGNGTVLVVGDSQFFTNPTFNVADNSVLIGNLFTNATVYVDTSHWPVNTIAGLKADLGQTYGQLSQYPVRYLLALAFLGLAIGLVPAPQGEARPRRKAAAKESTAFNPAVLERVRKDRERYGVEPE